jgi:signal peptidase I
MKKLKSALFELVETFVVSFVVIFLIYQYVASMEVVSGSSMEPNFETGERILVDKVSPYLRPYHRGEVVVLTPPNEPRKHYIKRIVGMPGDIIRIFDCKVLISNSEGQFTLKEEYLYPDTCTSSGSLLREGRAIRLNAGEYVVLGDNRQYSVDSRYFGVATRKELLGRVIFRFWPISKSGFLPKI